MTFDGCDTEGFHGELFLPDGSPRPEARQLVEHIEGRLVPELDYTDIVDVIRSGLHDFSSTRSRTSSTASGTRLRTRILAQRRQGESLP